ncbi:MAG: hypothetical protein M3323_01045 [Actinomycetota bacterium]|nr:hypothetical protein [Actinomycetota bacterium]
MELIVAAVGMAGLTLVAWMGRYFEHRKWERDTRLKAYSEFLAATDTLRRVISIEEWNGDAIASAQLQAGDAWRTMSLLASHDTAVKGRIYLGAMLATGAAISTPSFNDVVPRPIQRKIAFEFQNERMAFIAAARKDLNIKPAVLPKPSLEELQQAAKPPD